MSTEVLVIVITPFADIAKVNVAGPPEPLVLLSKVNVAVVPRPDTEYTDVVALENMLVNKLDTVTIPANPPVLPESVLIGKVKLSVPLVAGTALLLTDKLIMPEL